MKIIFIDPNRLIHFIVMLFLSTSLFAQRNDLNPHRLFNYPNSVNSEPRVINGVSVPNDFPLLIPTINEQPSPGKIFLSNANGNSYYAMIFENDGTPYYYEKVNHSSVDFKVQPNGLVSRYSVEHQGFIAMDSNYNLLHIFQAQNELGTDPHDFLLTNDNTAFLICVEYQMVDMSNLIPGGKTNATVIENVIQELDYNQNILFEWSSFNHFDITDAVDENLTVARIDYVHMNSIALDYDGNILVSSRHLSECTKINRQTGEIIWRLGGRNNEFMFINDNIPISYQHAFYPVEGNPNYYIIYDNGNKRENFTRVVEYKIDTQNMTAEKVWEYRADPDFFTQRAGNAQRLSNGNTFINMERPQHPKALEVTPDGQIVYQANLSPQLEAHQAYRFEWEGIAERPYLLSEPMLGSVRLIFNKFGDKNVEHYNIYGDPHTEPTTLVASTTQPWYDVDLRSFAGSAQYYFRITAVNVNGDESDYSNTETTYLYPMFSGYSIGTLGHSTSEETSDPQWSVSKGGFENALYFDGNNDFVNCGNDNSFQISGNQITLEAWIKAAQFQSSTEDGVIIAKDDAENGVNLGYSLACGSNGIVQFSISNEQLFETATPSNSIQSDQWYHIAATYDGSKQRIYINGNQTAESGSFNINIGNALNQNFLIGGSPFYDERHFGGNIDEVRVWNIALTQAQIQTMMNIQLGAEYYTDPTSGLIGYWRFNEGQGQITDDLARDNNLVLNGDFSYGESFWELVVITGYNAQGSVNDSDQYFVDVTNGGPSYESIQLKQSNILLIQNNTYTLEFDAWSSATKYFKLKIRKSDSPWTDYSRIGAAYVTSQVKHFQYTFTMTDYSDDHAELIFFIGENNVNFYLDNVRLTTDIGTGIINPSIKETDYKLIGNYPNPFNPETTIQYYIPEISHVKISIYNILGQLVKTLCDNIQTSGKYNVQFNANNLSSGVYFYTLFAESNQTSKSFYNVKKMILIK
ncbi:MAG: hypothetical protein A2V66_02075 [Ignavibacteria bacterium RBG_13_36_8]|nr:MAG: hypothetical protein A2V66_02075 [Ignavibacteria bacterium RBG_13_36_8]